MEHGSIVRIEELTRMPSDVQDALITVLSEKVLPIPELGGEMQARPGFNLIATANSRDRGVNELSSALRRRFNTVVLPTPATVEEEVLIVTQRVAAMAAMLSLPSVTTSADEIRRVVTVFRELRSGQSDDGRIKFKTPSGTMSTAEAISVMVQAIAMAAHLGDGSLHFDTLLGGIESTVVKDPVHDTVVWREYLDSLALR
jgi:MoxR-like ATPase